MTLRDLLLWLAVDVFIIVQGFRNLRRKATAPDGIGKVTK